MSAKNSPSTFLNREFVMKRIFNVPRELVFEAWTDPKHLAQWWGPKGFTNPTCQWDARPGGNIYDVMRAPDGTEHPMGGQFREIVKPERLVISCGALDDKGKMLFEFLHTMIFTERDGKTEMVLNSRVTMTTPEADKYIGGFEMGMSMSLDRLAEHLPTMKPGVDEFIITRIFNAPREKVWKAWTQRDRLMQWFGPKGCTISAAKLDFRPGGVFHYCMKTPDGKEMWGKFVYREIVPPEKIVLVNSFSDRDGGITRHPMSQTWPLEMLSTTTFTEQDGETTITLRWSPINETPQERRTFDSAHEGMNMGWKGTFDQLEEYLANAAHV